MGLFLQRGPATWVPGSALVACTLDPTPGPAPGSIQHLARAPGPFGSRPLNPLHMVPCTWPLGSAQSPGTLDPQYLTPWIHPLDPPAPVPRGEAATPPSHVSVSSDRCSCATLLRLRAALLSRLGACATIPRLGGCAAGGVGASCRSTFL